MSGQSVNFENLAAERDILIRIIQRGVTREELDELLGEVTQRLAIEILPDALARNQAQVGQYIAEDRRGSALRSVVGSLWRAAERDALTAFEGEPHVAALKAYLETHPELAERVTESRSGSTVEELIQLFGSLRDDHAHASDMVDYLYGFVLTLAFRFGNALRVLDPLARRSFGDPDILALSGMAALHIGLYSPALRDFVRAAASLHGDERATLQRRALAILHAGACHEKLLESEEAIARYEEALTMLEGGPRGSLNSLIRGLAHNNLGYSLMTISDPDCRSNNLESARVHFREALSLRQENGDSASNIATVHLNLMSVSRRLKDGPEARAQLDNARGCIDRLPERHILRATLANEEGIVAFYDRQDYRHALDCFRRARATLVANYGEEGEDYVLTCLSIAHAMHALGDREAPAEMERTHKEARRILRHDPDHEIIRMIEDDLSKM